MISRINILVWNVRGISRKDSQRYLHKLCVDNHIRLLVLIELMTDASQLLSICRMLHFSKGCSVLEGTMWVLWQDELVAQLREVGDQLANMEISWGGFTFLFSAVYAKCTRVGRRELWKAMESIHGINEGPWMVAGDFNVILNAQERSVGAPPNLRNMEEFNDAIFNCGLAEVDFDGSAITWTNGVLWQRLDRALSNAAWSELFSTTTVSHLMPGRSDHAPLLIKSGYPRHGSPAFRYLNVWKRYPNFLSVVQQAWHGSVNAGGMVGFHRKLVNLKPILWQWSWQVFCNIFQAVKKA